MTQLENVVSYAIVPPSVKKDCSSVNEDNAGNEAHLRFCSTELGTIETTGLIHRLNKTQ
jgi:hypothetical protein